jgi:DNA-binding response OmpR family regulator
MDDDATVLDAVAHALHSAGYRVRQARSRAAFEKAAKDPAIDIFIIDAMLPDGGGLENAREVRSRTDAGIILVSDRNDEIDRVIGLELGADDYVTKPLRMRELTARVNAVYRRTAPLRRHAGLGRAGTAPPEPELLSFHGWTMDVPARRVIGSSGQEADLTTLEFDVLRVLASRRNRVQSRGQIMDAVRGADWAACDRNVDGVISRLRRKLYPDGAGPQTIRTVHGVGYMLS